MLDENKNNNEELNENNLVNAEEVEIDKELEKHQYIHNIEQELQSLSDKEKLFILYYLQNMNPVQAAELVGAQKPRLYALRMMREPQIRKIIDKYVDSLFMSISEAQWRITEMANADMKYFIDYDESEGRYRINLDKAIKSGKTHLIKKIKESKSGEITIELHDALEALKHITKMHGLLKNNIDLGDEFNNTLKLIANRLKSVDELEKENKPLKSIEANGNIEKPKNNNGKQKKMANIKKEV